MKISTNAFFKIQRLISPVLFLLASTTYTHAQIGWTQVTSPDTSASRNMLRGISGTSSTDIWTVGYFEEPVVGNPFIIEKDLIMHWDGSGWQTFPPMNLSTTLDDLWDVESISASDVWAVGNYNAPGISTQAELLHYNGTNWIHQPLPINPSSSYLYSLDALSPVDIWAAGGQGATPTRPAYVIHYDGSSWNEIPVPPVGSYRNSFYAIDALSASDVWAVGHYGNMAGDFHTLAMHWNGSNWANIPLPSNVSSPPGELLNLKAISSNDIWASGYYLTGGAITLHWDGNSWTNYLPATGGNPFAGLATNNIFSFGENIKHWDGSSWTITDSLIQLSSPSLLNAVTFSNGDIWTCGRTIDTTGIFRTLVYRTVSDTPHFLRGPVQNAVALINTQTQIDSLFTIQDNDISQHLHISVITPPLHGSVAGFPTVAVTNNGMAQPSNLYYQPNLDYTGSDQFTVRVNVGNIASETIVHMQVAGILPITLLNFTVGKQEDDVLLQWNTSNEINTQHFEIEKSIDGNHFNLVGSVAAAGNSSQLLNYHFLDHFPARGSNFYRLKLINADGQVNIFPVKQINIVASADPFTIHPNPVNGKAVDIYISRELSDFTASLYDAFGQLVSTVIFTRNVSTMITLPLPEAASKGIYRVLIINNKHKYSQNVLVF